MKQVHVFTLSGLGQAPFSLCKPQESGVFFCEHCGTVLKNRFFIKSADGKVSVVGIDCLNKTGDNGLIDAVKAEKKAAADKERIDKIEAANAVHKEKEIAKFGMTKEDVVEQLVKEINSQKEIVEDVLEASFIYNILNKSDFGCSMINTLSNGESLSSNMERIVKEIVAKQMSGTNKNSKKYKETYPEAEKAVDSLLADIKVSSDKIKQLNAKRLEVLNTKV